MTIYENILQAKAKNEKLLAILIDPEKVTVEDAIILAKKIKNSPATHIFVGGSTFSGSHLGKLITVLKQKTNLPTLIFPGHPFQISEEADGILFLSLLSGRNPDYLIEHQINSVRILEQTNLEVISTAYLLIDGGKETAVQSVSQTKPIAHSDIELAYRTAKAGELLGMKLIYLEAGSGAKEPVTPQIISLVKGELEIPLIVGGGIRSIKQLDEAYKSGADMVVIGTAFEEDEAFFEQIKK